ncbi:ankyrin repeat-containing protein [Wolbachia endosymbiont of Cimex lectularius]|nr:ankyrin repeat-containing protein [Wolbachia endosymbiont of Cimex lectularius]
MEDNWGYTPLHVAAKHGYIKIINALLDKGISVDAVTGKDERTPLQVAAEYGTRQM